MMKPYDFCLKLICILFIVRKVVVNMENINFIITSGLGHGVKLNYNGSVSAFCCYINAFL